MSIGAIVAGIAQGALIIALLIHHRRRRRVEAALRRSEQKFASAFHASPCAISIHREQDGVIVDVNEGWVELFEIQRETAIGRAPFDLEIFTSAEDGERFRRVLTSRTAIRNRELQIRRGGGEACWVSVSCERIDLGGEPCLIGILQDITERKQVEESRQNLAHATRLALLGELTASIAHEINQPLGAILSNADAGEMLLSLAEPPLEELRAILGDIRKDDLRASEVIQRVRALLSKRPIETHPLDLNSILAEVLRLIALDAQRRGVKLVCELADPLPRIHGDLVHLQQVLLNLLLNGMDAMSDTPAPRRQLIIRSASDGAHWVEASVADAGHGIPAAELPLIFDSFFTTKEHGMGLGLAMVRSIVELHRGQITVDNNANGGATFRIRLPVNDTLEAELRM